MGIVAQTAAQEAYAARQAGKTIFAYRIRQDWTDTGRLSRELDNVADIVMAVEGQGWLLWQVSYYGDVDKPSGAYLFRPVP